MWFAARRGADVSAPGGLWMRSTSDNARNAEAFMPSPLRPAAPFSRPPRTAAFRARTPRRSWQQHLER